MTTDPEGIGERYMAAWKVAAVLLRSVRARELREVDTVQTLQSLLPAFERCVRERTLDNTSGLIEQQRIFAKFDER